MKDQENNVLSKEKSINYNPEMNQMLELTDKDFKTDKDLKTFSKSKTELVFNVCKFQQRNWKSHQRNRNN